MIAVEAALPPAPARMATVLVRDIEFRPARVVVRRGGTVRWRFDDGRVVHNVRSRGTKRFRSSPDLREGTYSARFRRAGTYRYVCTFHFNMKGTVVVR